MVDDAPRKIYSVGHGSRSEAALLEILHAHAIALLVDVRAYPASRRHPQFSRGNLEGQLKESGIRYLWLGDALGGFRKARDTSAHAALHPSALRGYAEHMGSDEFREGIKRLLAEAHKTTTAMMCAERLPQQCHRALIADYLVTHGIDVVHLLDGTLTARHVLNHAARRGTDGLTYDGLGEQLDFDL